MSTVQDKNLKIQQLTIKFYGLYRVREPLGSSDKKYKMLEEKMIKYAKQIKELGASINYEKDMITNYPIVRNLDNTPLPLDLGKMECETIISLIHNNSDKFISTY